MQHVTKYPLLKLAYIQEYYPSDIPQFSYHYDESLFQIYLVLFIHIFGI